jgi:Asp-tRNA(Asn)/Glu-tRNA(Gln) amidotransferase C subunit
MSRDKKLKEVLAPLSGRTKDVMEAILKNVDTEQLDEAYKTFIGRVIRESEATSSEKEDKVLAEGASKKPVVTKTVVETAIVKTGDTEVVTESEAPKAPNANLVRMQRIAGIK